MSFYKNLKISSKLLIGFIIVALLSGVVGIVSIINTSGIINLGTQLYQENLIPLQPAAKIQSDFLKVRVNIRDMVLAKTPEARAKFSSNIDNYYKDLQDNVQAYAKYVSSPEEAGNLKSMQDSIAKYDVVKDKVRELINSNKMDDALALMNGDAAVLAGQLDVSISKAFQINIDQAGNRQASNKAAGNKAIITIAAVVGVTIVLAVILGLIISNMIGRPIKMLVDASKSIAEGELNVQLSLDSKDEIGILGKAFEKIIASLKNLVNDANMLAQAAVEGKLQTRADASKHSGDYRKVVEGVNNTLDAVIRPLNVTADYVDKISKGNIPSKITDIYNGDFNIIKNNLNLCIDSINLLVSDSDVLVQAALAGKLSTRADASRHNGDYRKIVEGVNNTLDAVIEPVKEAANVLKEMSNGNLKVRVRGDYKGDHADIKNALNDTIDALSSYITEISGVLQEMSNSNLQLSINNEYKGDFAQIKDALNLIIQSFNEIFTEINNAADQVSSGSTQVSDGSQALSQGTTEQASSIEQLTSSITEVAAQTKQNAVNAGQANELALSAKNGAVQGNAHMKEMLKSMDEINESSTNISKIIKVIDDIAFQTNILALNAAVEAARAGQHGKGFAVVAEEVRNLAARSANAAKETTDLIEGSINKVELGTKIANNTAEALDQIVEGVSKAATLVGEIATASNEQATAISQINKGIEQVSSVVQTNSATAEESAAASEELSSQASMLKNMVGKFRLKNSSFSSYSESNLEFTKKTNHGKRTASEAALTKSKPVISLSDKDFGKY